MQPQKYKTIKHLHDPGHLHELTFSCYQQMPLLMDDQRRKLFSESIDRANSSHEFELIAFVFMPDHVHLLVFPRTGSPKPVEERISDLLFAMKRPFSFRVKQLLLTTHPDLLRKLTVQQRPGKTTFRFWQEGPGYDRSIFNPEAIQGSIDYIHNNPVRRNLCQRATDWKWSSARWFAEPTMTPDEDLPKLTRLFPDWNLR